MQINLPKVSSRRDRNDDENDHDMEHDGRPLKSMAVILKGGYHRDRQHNNNDDNNNE